MTLPPDRAWFEGAFLIRGLTRQEAISIGVEFGQGAIVEWQRGRLTLLPTGLLPDLDLVTRSASIRPAPDWCPVRDDERPGAFCVQIGGPYGSAAIHACAMFIKHHGVAIDLLGCGTCEDGRLPDEQRQYPTSHADNVIIGSRHGGTFWPPPDPSMERESGRREPHDA